MSAEMKRRWRDYRTAAGRRPIKEFIDELSDIDAAAVVAAMREVQELGLSAARHLRGDIYEVRAEGDRQIFRILFATEEAVALRSFSRLRASRRRRERPRLRRSAWRSGGSANGDAVVARDRDLSHRRDIVGAMLRACPRTRTSSRKSSLSVRRGIRSSRGSSMLPFAGASFSGRLERNARSLASRRRP